MNDELLTIRQVSQELGIPIYTIRYFCNHGLVPNVRRTRVGRRVFTREQCDWISSLQKLRECQFKIDELKRYTWLCRTGDSTISKRRAILNTQKRQLRCEIEKMNCAIDFIERREELFDAILAGKDHDHSQWL